ncbi:flagellar hook-associated protein FlgK [Azohydromonas caseinilytica]|uniref:Flagellar hook-associated protein 1 n=1 Tax=Azohydromonas caseinilytica TaxID=2728836 RepID=A0A848F695_9BURK|nr:flagellar hook-associated protein FlgK [Azohydromonas caseinilytica]NML14912.1 flagellar hook-associated protein FlgK [Azohydromonas caseinilytica]
MAISLFSIAGRAMSASYAALQTTSHNVANASVQGYSRQRVEQEAVMGRRAGAGFIGAGVNVTTVSRAHSEFLTREARSSTSLAALDSTHLELLSSLEDAFPTGEGGVGQAVTDLFSAFSDLASYPADTSAREAVLARADELAQRFATAGEHIDALQSGVVTDLRNSVSSINQLSGNIARLNQEIAGLQAQGQAPNDLLDKRDQMLQELSGFLPITTIAADDGSVGVFTAGGQRLVLGKEAAKLEVQSDSLDPSRATLGLREANGTVIRLDSTALSAGGSVGAMLRFQNQDLVAARNSLGQMATALSARMNQQQARGLDLGSPSGAGQALFTDFVQQSQSGALTGRPDTRNSRDASGNPVATVEIHIDDASLLEAAEYTLETQADGSFVMTRGSDGERFLSADGSSFTRATVTPPATSDFHPGFTLAISGPPAPGDRFLLQPVGQSALNIRRVLDNPRGLAASAPITATATAGNTGTATVGSLTVTASSFDPTRKLQGTVTFTDDSGGYTYDWQQLDASNTVVASGTASGTWASGKAVDLDGFAELKLSGSPKAGDTIGIATTPYPGRNNGNAQALTALRTETLVGRDWTSGGNTGGATATDAYAAALADVGTRVQSAEFASDISSAAATAALERRDSVSGVDLDEEAARLLEFQKSYQAAAKVLQTAQAVFDALLDATSGR